MNERDKEFAKQAGLRTYQEKAPGLDGMVGSWESFEVLFSFIRADEREACALICDEHSDDPVYCGAAIRARGNT